MQKFGCLSLPLYTQSSIDKLCGFPQTNVRFLLSYIEQ